MPDLVSIARFLPAYLHDVEDYLSLTSASRGIRSAVHESTTPHALLTLCYSSRRTFFRPDPLFLIIALASGIPLYAAESRTHLQRVVEAFWGGDDTLITFLVSTPAIASHAQWSLGRVRTLWERRMRVLNPLSDLLDKCVGKQWYETPNFWMGGAWDAVTLYAEADELGFRMILYGEVFGKGWEAWMENVKRGQASAPTPPEFSVTTRFELLKYLMPDWHVPPHTGAGPSLSQFSEVASARLVRADEVSFFSEPVSIIVDRETGYTRKITPLKAVQTLSGPYVDFYAKAMRENTRSEHQTSAIHLLSVSPLWKKIQSRVAEQCGGPFEVEAEPDYTKSIWDAKSTKQDLWDNALYMLGYEGMDMLIQAWKAIKAGEAGGTRVEIEEEGPGWAKLREWRGIIAGIEDGIELDKVHVGSRWTYEVPHFLRDMAVLVWDR